MMNIRPITLAVIIAAVALAWPATAWSIQLNQTPSFIMYDFGQARTINQYTLASDIDLPGNQSWLVQGSNDGQALKMLGEQNGISFTAGDPQGLLITAPAPYRYYRFDFLTGFNGTPNVEIHLLYNYSDVKAASKILTVKADMGETWIKWSWKNATPGAPMPDFPYTLYVDGRIAAGSVNLTTYYLQGLAANEEHKLEVHRAADNALLATSTVRTLPHEATVQVLLILVAIVWGCIVLVAPDQRGVFIMGGIGAVLSNYARSLAYNYYGIDLVFLSLTFLFGSAMVFAVLGWVREQLSWTNEKRRVNIHAW